MKFAIHVLDLQSVLFTLRRVKRRYESWKKFGTPVFDSLKAARYPKLADGKVSLPSLQTADLLSKVLGCEVIVSTAAIEADEETVRIARARGAFSILGQDSDYLMYDTGDVAYLSLKHFGTYSLPHILESAKCWGCFFQI